MNKSRLVSSEQENKFSSDWKHESFSALQVLMMGWLPTLLHLLHASYWPQNKVKLMQMEMLNANLRHLCWPWITLHSWTLWHRIRSELLGGFKPFKTRERATSTQKQREAEGKKPRLRGPVRHSKTSWAFTVVNGAQSSSINNREQRGAWMGYRKKTRTDVSINWRSCGASLLSLRLLQSIYLSLVSNPVWCWLLMMVKFIN